MLPSRGKNKIEIIFCTVLISLAQWGCRYKAALVLQICTVPAILASDHCPSENRSSSSQHHTELGMAGELWDTLPSWQHVAGATDMVSVGFVQILL